MSYPTRKTMKNVSKNKFFTCFRPVVDIDTMLDSEAVVDHSSSRRFMCIPVSDKHDTKNSGTKSKFSDQECSKLTQNRVMRQPSKQTLAKVIKAVVFQTILNTRARNKKRNSQTCFGSKRSYSAFTESSSTGDVKSMVKLTSLDSNIKEIKALELSSSSSSSSSSGSESKSTKVQLKKQKKFQYQGIYMILLSLVVTIFWGKINVSILTSMLFCFFSLWNASCRGLKEVSKLRNTESKANKNSHRNHNGRIG